MPYIPYTQGWYLGHRLRGDTRLAVSFTLAQAQVVRHLYIRLMKRWDWGTLWGAAQNSIQYLEWEIREDAPGPTGTLKASGTFAWTDELFPYLAERLQTIRVNDAALTAGTYWFILKTPNDTVDLEFPVWWICGNDTGTLYCYNGVWYSETNVALPGLTLDTLQAGVDWEIIIDGQGYMTPDNMRSYREALAQPPLARIGVATKEYSTLAWPYTTISQSSFHRGRGQYEMELPDAYWDSAIGAYTVKARQLILPPLAVETFLDTYEANIPHYEVGTTRKMRVFPCEEQAGQLYIAQKFTPAANITATSLSVFARKVERHGADWKIQLRDDNLGVPGTVLAEGTITFDDTSWYPSWHRVTCNVALTGGTDYWICVYTPEGDTKTPYLGIYTDDSGGAPGGAAYISADGSAWNAWAGVSLFFRLNWRDTSYQMAGDVNGFAEYDGKLWCIAGAACYYWDATNDYWAASKTDFLDECSSIVFFNDALWVAVTQVNGTQNMWKYDTVNGWVQQTVPAQGLWVARGYLWRSVGNKLYYSNDGTNWSSAITVGLDEYWINDLAEYEGEIHVAKDEGVYYIDQNDIAHSRIPYPDMVGYTNGIGMLVWAGYLWIPVWWKLWRWNGSRWDERGPQGPYGLPKDLNGPIWGTAGSALGLFCTINGDSTRYPSLWLFDGVGWHKLWQSTYPASSRAVHLSWEIENELRVWWGCGRQVYYMKLPLYTDNPFEETGSQFAPMGGISTSWWDGGVKHIRKHIRELRVECDALSNAKGCYIQVNYSIDGEGTQHLLGYLYEDSPSNVLEFPTDFYCYTLQLHFWLYSEHANYTPRIKGYGLDAIAHPDPRYVVTLRVVIGDEVENLKGEPDTTRTAEDMMGDLKAAARKKTPIVVADPNQTYEAFITNLAFVTLQFAKEGGEGWKWQKIAELALAKA